MTAKNIARAKVFILDWDGVLAETQLDFAPLRQKYFGGERVPLIEAAAALPAPLRAEVEAEIYRVEMGGAERAAAVEGAKDLLAWLTETRRPWSVVSRNCRDSILLAAQRCGIVLPPVVLSREEPYVKPAPEALALAAERMGAKLRNCVMVGDFVHDLQAAQNAGIPFVLVKASGAEWERNANFTYPTVTEFVRDMKRNFSKSDD
ncbi:MAG: HAD-IA family hydrolase [Synergistaceae bacterium]|jgi:HAD superfamily hydrolase (TIGR01549 family)|nr:HAD-IA family hydrolase [Synergistaceae bacterium]